MKSGFTLLAPLALSFVVAGCSGQPGQSEESATGESSVTAEQSGAERPTTLAMGGPGGSDAAGTSDAATTRGEEEAASSEATPGASGDASSSGSDRPSIYTGVYTTAQAARGREIQERECSACHTPADWSGGRVLANYTGLSPLDLVEQLKATMPMDGPGRLSYQEYVDVVSFIFQVNGVPAGQQELPAEGSGIATPRIEYRRQ